MKKTIVNIENSPRETKGEFNLFKILENYVQEVGNINFKILIKKHNEDLLEDLNSKIKSLEEEIKNNSSEEKEKILLDCKEHLKAFTLPKEERKLYTLTSEKFFKSLNISMFKNYLSFSLEEFNHGKDNLLRSDLFVNVLEIYEENYILNTGIEETYTNKNEETKTRIRKDFLGANVKIYLDRF